MNLHKWSVGFIRLVLLLILYPISMANAENACDSFAGNVDVQLNDSEVLKIEDLLKQSPEFTLNPAELKFNICYDKFAISLKTSKLDMIIQTKLESSQSKVHFQSEGSQSSSNIFYIKIENTKYPIKVEKDKLITLLRATSTCANNPNIWLGWTYVDSQGIRHHDHGHCGN